MLPKEDIAFLLCAAIFIIAQFAYTWDDDWNPDCTAESPGPCEGPEGFSDSFPTSRGYTAPIVICLLAIYLASRWRWGRKKGAIFLILLLLYLVGVWIAKISVARGGGGETGDPQCNALLPQSNIFTDGAHMTYKIFIYLIMIYLLFQFHGMSNPGLAPFLILLFAFPAIILFNEAAGWVVGVNIDEEGASGKSIDIVELYKNYILGPGKPNVTYGDSPDDDRGGWWIAEGPKLLLRLALVGALIYGAKKLTSPWSARPWMALVFVFIITAGFPFILRFMISDNCLFSRVADEEKTRMNKLTGAKWWRCTLDKYGGIQAWFIFVVAAYIISGTKS